MNWKHVFVAGALAWMPMAMSAQANILNAKKPEEIGKKTEAQAALDNDTPLAYGYVDDRGHPLVQDRVGGDRSG